MRTLETNDWLLLNSIIYKIYTMNNISDMREQFLEQIKMLIDFDSADFHLASPTGENKLVSPVLFNCEEDLSVAYSPFTQPILLQLIRRVQKKLSKVF